MYHGKGLEMVFDGSKYIGEYKNGTKDGIGKFWWADGSTYLG